ncbi:MAG: hypothetical protein LBB24_03285, partial [Rickettsiales bacterium]|nr:hypothetical protein [Rickettsiales bacterium]
MTGNIIKRPNFTREEASRFGRIGAQKTNKILKAKKNLCAVLTDLMCEEVGNSGKTVMEAMYRTIIDIALDNSSSNMERLKAVELCDKIIGREDVIRLSRSSTIVIQDLSKLSDETLIRLAKATEKEMEDEE